MEMIVVILIILGFALGFGIGSNDETMAPILSAKIINIKQLVILAGSLSFLGCFFLSENVGKTIGKSLLSSQVTYNSYMMIAIILSTFIWLVVASKTGAPISTTHSVVGSIIGLTFVLAVNQNINWIETINWSKLNGVFIGWLISPILGFIAAFLLQIAMDSVIRKRNTGLIKIENNEKIFIAFLLVSVCWTQLSRGGNDAANAIGVFYGLIEVNNASPGSGIEPSLLSPLIFVTGIFMALGIIVLGRFVIQNVGNGLIELRPSRAFTVSLSTTIVLYLATIGGFPVSGTHILIFAMIGAGFVKGEKPDKKSLNKMIISWIITIPIAAILCALLYLSFLPFI